MLIQQYTCVEGDTVLSYLLGTNVLILVHLVQQFHIKHHSLTSINYLVRY